MKRTLIAAAAAAALFSATAWAQMGPGMMGGGAQGMGPGMMGHGMMGHGMMGQGMMGQGMMGQGMMGQGMMPGYGSYGGINLSDEQRAKIAEIQQEVSRKQSDLMSDAHKAMFEISLDARKRIDALLTKEQREQLQSDRHCG